MGISLGLFRSKHHANNDCAQANNQTCGRSLKPNESGLAW